MSLRFVKFQLAFAFAIASLGCDGRQASKAGDAAPVQEHTLTIEVSTPSGEAQVYLTGNIDALGPWRPDALAMTRVADGAKALWTASVNLPAGYSFEYKFTLGAWTREATGPSGMVMPNFVAVADANKTIRNEIVDFKKEPAAYMADWRASGVVGDLVYWTDVTSTHLREPRHVGVWLPPGYENASEKRYRVIYMSDGQNLFDPRIANTGVDWGVDEAMMAGVAAGDFEPAIVVSVWSSSQRGREYSPWHDAPLYARFLIEELMPRVNAEFRTLTGPQNTFHMGSSMGGLLSFYLVQRFPEVFSACGCVSTHTPFSEAVAASFSGGDASKADERPYILGDIEAGALMPRGQRLFLDYGTETLDAAYGPGHEAVRAWLLAQGFVEGTDFLVREYEGAAHNETSWRARVGDQLAWLLAEKAPD